MDPTHPITRTQTPPRLCASAREPPDPDGAGEVRLGKAATLSDDCFLRSPAVARDHRWRSDLACLFYVLFQNLLLFPHFHFRFREGGECFDEWVDRVAQAEGGGAITAGAVHRDDDILEDLLDLSDLLHGQFLRGHHIHEESHVCVERKVIEERGCIGAEVECLGDVGAWTTRMGELCQGPGLIGSGGEEDTILQEGDVSIGEDVGHR